MVYLYINSCKIVAYYAKSSDWIIVLLFCGITYYLNYKKIYLDSSQANVILAYPFFITGVYAQKIYLCFKGEEGFPETHASL